MKNTITAICILVCSSQLRAQGVLIGDAASATPDASALLELNVSGMSNKKGVLLPRMTESQRDAIASPATSLLIYQTDGDEGYYYYDGSDWTTFGDSTDDLGDHIATENLEMDGNWLSSDGDDEGVFVDSDGNVGIMVGNPTATFHTGGTVRHEFLSGTGNRMVIADEDGNLSTQEIPSPVPTSKSSSSNHSISSASYSSGSSVISDITLEDMPAGTYLVQYSLVFSGASAGAFIVYADGSNVTVSEREESSGNVNGMAVVTLTATGDIKLKGKKSGGGWGFTVTNRTLSAIPTN